MRFYSVFAVFVAVAAFSLVEPSAADEVLPMTDTQFVTFAKCSFITFGEFTYEEAKSAHAALAFFVSASEEHAVRKHINWNSVPGFQSGSEWVGQLWLGMRRGSGSNSWVWDNPIMPGYPVPFTPWANGVNGSVEANSAGCVISREDGWTPYDCDGNVNGAKVLAGALCTTATRDPSDLATLSTNACGALLSPPSSNSLALALVIKKNYFFIKGNFNFDQAVAACSAKQAQLSTARNLEDFAFLTTNLNFTDVGGSAWLGLRRVAPGSSQFVWIDMMPNFYTVPFANGQPDASGDCVSYFVDHDGKIGWRTAACSDTTNAVCEAFAMP